MTNRNNKCDKNTEGTRKKSGQSSMDKQSAEEVSTTVPVIIFTRKHTEALNGGQRTGARVGLGVKPGRWEIQLLHQPAASDPTNTNATQK